MVEDEMKAVEHTFIHEKMNEQKEKDHSKVKLSDNDKKEIKKISERRVKLALLFSHIGEEHSVKVSSQELQAELDKQYECILDKKNYKRTLSKNPAELTKLRGPIFEDKVMNLIIEKSKVKVKTITKDDLQKLLSAKDTKETKAKVKNTTKSKAKKVAKSNQYI